MGQVRYYPGYPTRKYFQIMYKIRIRERSLFIDWGVGGGGRGWEDFGVNKVKFSLLSPL